MSGSLQPQGLYNSPGQNTGVDSLSLLQGIFPTQESNWGLLHCRQILYQLSYEGKFPYSLAHWSREWQTTSVFLPWEPHEQYEKSNDRILKEELPRSAGAQYATGDQWRNNSRKNEGMEPKQKQYPVLDVTGDRSKVWCCKEQYCIGTWNVRFMNQGKLEVVKWDGKSECRHSRNQQTKMDWNGWI